MGVFDRLWDAIQTVSEVSLRLKSMDDERRRMAATVRELSDQIRNINSRVVRLETIVEIAPKRLSDESPGLDT